MAFLRLQGKIWHVVYYEEGKLKSFTTKQKNRTEANRILRKFSAKKELNISLDMPKSEKILFSKASKEFLSTKENEETIRSYQCVAGRWIGIVGDKYIHKYSDEDCKFFLTRLNFLSQNSLASYTRQLSIIFNYFIKLKYIEVNPIKKIKPIDKEPNPAPLREYHLLRRDFFVRGYIRQFDLVSLLYLCALRITEGINLRGEDFDFKNKLIYLRNSKGKRIDMIPMLKDIEEHLSQMEIPKGKFFDYASRDSVKSIWIHANQRYGFHNTLHSLRKARGTELANSGVEPLFLQKFMRHRDFRTTLKFYVKIDLDKMRENINGKI